jgi:hypothetical protein
MFLPICNIVSPEVFRKKECLAYVFRHLPPYLLLGGDLKDSLEFKLWKNALRVILAVTVTPLLEEESTLDLWKLHLDPKLNFTMTVILTMIG